MARIPYEEEMRGAPAQVQGEVKVLKGVPGDGEGFLLVDDLVDAGRTARIVRQLLPKAYFATPIKEGGRVSSGP